MYFMLLYDMLGFFPKIIIIWANKSDRLIDLIWLFSSPHLNYTEIYGLMTQVRYQIVKRNLAKDFYGNYREVSIFLIYWYFVY